MKYKTLSFLFFSLTVFGLKAQTDTLESPGNIVTDRPSQSASAWLIPDGYWQAEFGFAKINQESGSSFIYPNALFKYGLSDHFELRFMTSYVTIQESGEEDINGFFPLSVGFKTDIGEENGLWPKISFLGHFLLPNIVNERIAIDHLAPDLRFAFQHGINDNLSLGYNLGVFWDGSSPDPIYFYSLVPGFTIGRFWVYAEGYGYIFTGNSPKGALLIDGGVTYLVNRDFQVDLTVGQNINAYIVENYIALGLSFRFH